MIAIREINELNAAKKIWEELSPKKSIFDDWHYRYCFYKYDPCPLHFYVAYEEQNGQEVAVGLMPLQYNKDWGGLEFFAEEPCADNKIFCLPGYGHLIPLFYQHLKGAAKFYDIEGDDEFTNKLPIEDYVYYLNVSKLKDFKEYLYQAFPTAKKRNNFERLFRILERDHQVEVLYNNFSDLELLMDLNVKHFGEESYLRTDEERRPFRDLLSLPLDWRMITIVVDGEKLACSLAVIYEGTYFYMIIGSDISKVTDVFKYLTKANLELALKEGVTIFDCALGNCGWKEYWHFDKKPQYEFIKED